MSYLYLLLNLGSLLIPFIFSFHPKLKFYNYWKPLFIAIPLTMCVFIPWDVIFTSHGFWGFNNTYLLGTHILGLPIEEWLFFICIPYACVFTHYALLHYFPNLKIQKTSVNAVSYIILAILILVALLNYDKWYTFINFVYAVIILLIVLKTRIELLQSFFLTFLVMLVPFFIINGILTGSGIEHEVVWYNNDENLSIRMLTIPIEDTIYAFSLILTNLYIMTFFKNKNLVSTS